MSNSYTVTVIGGYEKNNHFSFTVIFHDGCRKDYNIDIYAFMAARTSHRDFIEQTILDHYEEFYGERPELSINFY